MTSYETQHVRLSATPLLIQYRKSVDLEIGEECFI